MIELAEAKVFLSALLNTNGEETLELIELYQTKRPDYVGAIEKMQSEIETLRTARKF